MTKSLVLPGALAALLSVTALTNANADSPMATVQIAQAGASAEWDELLKAARREGELELILSGQVPQKLRPGMAQFEKKYGVKVNFQTGGGSAHAERILAERRVGRYTLDVWLGGANTPLVSLVPNKALESFPELLIDPEVKDTSAWFQGKHHYSDPESRYIFTYAASPNTPFSYNTKMVKPEEFKSFWDFLDPKWKGKIVSWSPGDQGTAPNSLSLYLNPKVGEEWFRRWAKEMNVTIVQDARQGAEWVALGRFPIGMFGLSTQAEQLSKQGFPIDSMDLNMIEGDALVASASNLMVMNKAPHPNAAKLFVNWALSKEGQTLFIKLQESMDSLRTDIPKDNIEERYRIRADRDYLVTFTNPDYINRQGEFINKLRQIMQEAGYR
jgi:ABC-type Fe3+ transport system substrate-binding protein